MVLSDWLGLHAAAAATATATTDTTAADSVALLALLLRVGAALPRHVGLIAAGLNAADNARLRLVAVQGLGSLGPSLARPLLPALAARMQQDRCARVRAAALEAVTGGYTIELAPFARPYLPQVIAGLGGDPAPSVRRTAADALGGRLASLVLAEEEKEPATVVPAIARHLRSRWPPTREAALRALYGLLLASSSSSSSSSPSSAPPRLLALHVDVATLASKDPSPALRALALTFLGRLPLPLALPHLGEAVLPRLGDGQPEVQAAALGALERLGRRQQQQQEQGEGAALSDALHHHARTLVGLFQRPPTPGGAARAHRTRMAVLQALSAFLPPSALEPYVGELAACVGWEATPQQQQDEQAKRRQQQPLRSLSSSSVLASPSSSSSSLHRGLGGYYSPESPRPRSAPSSPSPPAAAAATAAARAAAAGAGALRPRPRRLVFEEEEEEEGDSTEEEEGPDSVGTAGAEAAVMEALLALLGRMRTAVVLPLLPGLTRRFLLARLADPRVPEAAAVATTQAALGRARNPEIRRQCLAQLLLRSLRSGGEGTDKGTGKCAGVGRARVLTLMTAAAVEEKAAANGPLLLPLQPAEAEAVASCLLDPAPRVRRDACLLLLRSVASCSGLEKPQQQQQQQARALAAFLKGEGEGDLGWLTAALQGDKALRGAAASLLLLRCGDGRDKENTRQGNAQPCPKLLQQLLLQAGGHAADEQKEKVKAGTLSRGAKLKQD